MNTEKDGMHHGEDERRRAVATRYKKKKKKKKSIPDNLLKCAIHHHYHQHHHHLHRHRHYTIATFLVTSPIVINVPTRGLLAVETMHAIVRWLTNLNIKRNMTSMFVNKKHRY